MHSVRLSMLEVKGWNSWVRGRFAHGPAAPASGAGDDVDLPFVILSFV